MGSLEYECCAYLNDEGVCVESYKEHVRRAITVWKELKPYYSQALQRVLGYSNPECDVIELSLLLHDLGKLVKDYFDFKKRRSRGILRHEIIGAYSVWIALEKLGVNSVARDILALAVMLHHEPIILSAYVTGLGEWYLTVANLKRVLSEAELETNCDIDRLISELEEVVKSCNMKYITSVISSELRDLENKRDDMIRVLRELIARFSVGEPSRLRELRARVAAVAQILVVADSVAAYYGRSLCKGSEDGTWTAKQALRGAEILDVDRLRSVLCG